MTHHPYMQITLSTRPLGREAKPNITCQYVTVKRKDAPLKREKNVSAIPKIAAESEGLDIGEIIQRGEDGKKRKSLPSQDSAGRGKKRKVLPDARK